ncbi:MAG: hypothetical protein EBU84_12640 [Actinobacteria bacterium]|nr:hypothetical protein [Actinomycetota bacterium]
MPLLTVDSTGHIRSFAGSSAPPGYLLCDGSLLNRADYPSLFALISTNYNTGGETTAQFRIPDYRGKLRLGSGTRTIKTFVGTETHSLTIAQLPPHTHSGTTDTSADTHTHTGTSNQNPSMAHNHTYLYTWNRGDANNCSGRPISGVDYPQSTGSTVSLVHNHNVTIGTATGTHIHSTYTSASTGSDNGHNNMMPSAVVNFYIKY